MWAWLGRLWKGRATIAGIVTTVIGVLTGTRVQGGEAWSDAVKALVEHVPAVVSAIVTLGGLALALFGSGRKAAVAAVAEGMGSTEAQVVTAIKDGPPGVAILTGKR